MRKATSRLIALLLAFVMILGSVPSIAFAEDAKPAEEASAG